MDSFDIYIFEDIEKAMSQRDKKQAAASAASTRPPVDSIYGNEFLRVAGVCALGGLCLTQKSIPIRVSRALMSEQALVGSILSGLGFAFLKSSSRLAVKPRVVW